MFRVRLKHYPKGIEIFDGRDGSAGVIDVGANQSVTIGGVSTALVNDQTHIILGTFNDDPNTWAGMYVVFSSGDNIRLGAQISSISREDGSNDICYLTLDRRLASTPAVGDTFWVIGLHPFASASTQGIVLSLEKEIADVVFSTDVDNGYTTCEVTLNEYANHLGRIFSTLMGKYFILEDVWGHTCFSGIVTAVNIDGFGGSMTATGLRKTFEWYILDDLVYAGTITCTEVIRDVVQSNPFVLYSEAAIDPLDVWKNAQTSASISVGPRTYEESNYSAHQILQDILDLGYYGVSEDKIVLQVWDDLYPVLRVIKRLPTDADLKYMIPASAFEYNFKGFNLQVDVANTEGMTYFNYTDANGETNRSTIAVNMNVIQSFGFRNKAHSISDDQEGSAISAARSTSMGTSNFGGPGSLSLHGYVRGKRGLAMIPVHHIKAGSVVKIESQIGSTSLYRNMNVNSGFFTVGSTSYQASTGVLTLTVSELPTIAEFFQTRIDL